MRVREINRLTSSWLRSSTDQPGVASGVGVWPLLALLAASADEPGRSELAEAVGLPADACMAAAREAMTALGEIDGVDAAIGVWAQSAARIDPEWAAQLPVAALGELSGDPTVDQPRLDEWARTGTRGLIERFPIDTDPDLMLTLATAIALRTTWTTPFNDDRLVPKSGPWTGQRLAGLHRTTSQLDDVRVATTPAGEVTLVRVEGDNGLDVHLVLGEEGQVPADVLPAGMAALSGGHAIQTGTELLDAGDPSPPGVAVVRAQRRSLALATTRFTVRADHDLMTHANLFGLQTVSRSDSGHFPRIGPVPLRVDQARQAAVAIFSATGFEAGAVTAVGLRMVSMPALRERGLQVTFDRPFGFLAVHRASELVLFAGWVDSAEPHSR